MKASLTLAEKAQNLEGVTDEEGRAARREWDDFTLQAFSACRGQYHLLALSVLEKPVFPSDELISRLGPGRAKILGKASAMLQTCAEEMRGFEVPADYEEPEESAPARDKPNGQEPEGPVS